MRRLIIISLLLVAVSAHAAVQNGLAPRAGTLLVATEQLKDPRFQQSVILITRHDVQGTTGLILNRQLGQLPVDLKSSLRTLPHGLFWGGPVASLHVTALLFGQQPAIGVPLAPGLSLLTSDELSTILHQKPLEEGEMRAYLGYAGWAPRQLAYEIARGDWSVLPVNAAPLQRLAPEQMWQALAPVSESPWI